ncbi:MAG: aldehyde dehydrogenase, partial [bacterium]|nr:aldehyde dehydrogenase [bacterium]
TLATIAGPRPSNLAIAVLDNEAYGETGLQPTHTANGIDLADFARVARFAQAETVWEASEVERAARLLRTADGPVLVVFKILAQKLGIVSPPRDGAYVKARFREALLGRAI